MNSKNSDGIEFEVEDIEEFLNKTVYVSLDNNLESKAIVRKYFRLPVSNPDEVKVKINDQQYDIIDILSEGIGIHLPRPGIFSVGKELNSIKLTFQGGIFKLHGEVVYISPYEQGNYRCGIKFIDQDQDKESKRIISEYIKINRAKLFS
ncbi:MAG: PilZ domain-containing protein [Methanosarcinales archaeon]|nr:PilZ domain-containing protein [Methanosarcinales archaeon]